MEGKSGGTGDFESICNKKPLLTDNCNDWKVFFFGLYSDVVILSRLVGESNGDGKHGADDDRIDGDDGDGDGEDEDDDDDGDDKMEGGDEEKSQLSLNFLLFLFPTLTSFIM